MKYFFALLMLTAGCFLTMPAHAAKTSESLTAISSTALAAPNVGHKLTFKEKVATKLLKRAIKRAERKVAKRGGQAVQTTFPDLVVLAGAIVTIVGIISIISSPIHGLIVALLGLVVYILGRSAGGSLSNIF